MSGRRRRGWVRLYAEGAIIRSKQGLFLAIPTPAAGRCGDARQKITPERIHGLRLRFVYRRGSPSLLVADNAWLTKRGRAGVFLPKPKHAVSGPGGVEASFDWRAAYDEVSGTMLRARLLNDVASYM